MRTERDPYKLRSVSYRGLEAGLGLLLLRDGIIEARGARAHLLYIKGI